MPPGGGVGTVMRGDKLQANLQTPVLRTLEKPESNPDWTRGLQAQLMFPG